VHTAKLVSITVTSAKATIKRGETVQCTATGYFLNGKTQDLTQSVLWSSTNENVATISNEKDHRGLATGVGSGTTNIEATWSGISGITATALAVL
jgi:hypothetical protein